MSPKPAYYAHTLPGQPEEFWEPLSEHLENTAERAARNAAAFGAEEWGALAGLWHDLGKYQPEFQDRLRGSRIQVDHAGAGTALAWDRRAVPLAFVIAGHHGGMPNLTDARDTARTAVRDRAQKNKEVLDSLLSVIPRDLWNRPIPPLPGFLSGPISQSGGSKEVAARRLEMWTRFLFSALVDADYLATESFLKPGARDVVVGFDSIGVLRERLNAHLDTFDSGSSLVNRQRAKVLADCRAKAERTPGFFSLTVPTGGGKTFSSMAFALRHAERNVLRRVIVAIPYTSIIEQNAREYCQVLGSRNVIEHHSAVDEAKREQEERELEVRRKLAAENWDAPVIVTTNVQFFESLFASRPGRCRKLHNIARSVIVLDEAQSLPTDYLACLLEGLRELVCNYGCSIVLSTATQPALEKRAALPIGLENVQEIIDEPADLFRALERVNVHWPDPDTPPTPYEELAREISGQDQALAIVHRRDDARKLASLLPEAHRFHLSALMCPAHRTEVLEEVRARLRKGKPCRVVSTQLVEAGVDVDFPVVYRALAGLDSVAQAAGRCNREGRMERGTVVVFRAETKPPSMHLRAGLEITEEMLREFGNCLSFTDPGCLDGYFRRFYATRNTDTKGVQREREQLNFATVAELVQLIEDGGQHPVAVLWGEGEDRVDAFAASPSRETQRALQPYMVQVYQRELDTLLALGAVEHLHEMIHVLTEPFAHLYHKHFGLVVDGEAAADASRL